MNKFSANKNRSLLVMGLGSAIAISVLLSPLASSNPDGLDRVAQDHQFDQKADENPLSHKLPFRKVFDEYTMRGVPSSVATPLAGLVGTLVTFGLTWGLGKMLVKKSDSTH